MASGKLTCGQIVVSEDSLAMDQITDVSASNPMHNDVIIYKDNAQDALFTTGFHATPLQLENFTNVNSQTIPVHNDLLVYNENAQDTAFPDGWVNKGISSVFTGLNETISAIVSSTDAVVQGQNGNPGRGDMVIFSDDTANGDGTTTVSIGSAFDNNAIFKRETVDSAFSFVQNLAIGQVLNTSYPIGTSLRSTKGIYGFSGPFPTPLGVPSLSFNNTKFSTTVTGTTVVISSLGIEVTVTLFESDGITISDGPTVIGSNQVQTFTCNGTGEFQVVSTGAVIGYVNGNGTQKRLLVPMTTDLLVHNRNLLVCSLEGTANVTMYRRNGTTTTTTVTSGTPTALTTSGSQDNWALGGWLRLKSDVPICAFQNTDSNGNGATPGWPVDQLSQRFPIPGSISVTTVESLSSIIICSTYEGRADIYDNSNVLVGTANYTRPGTVTDQTFPSAGLWNPTVAFTGGYVQTTTPALCIVNMNGSSVWTSDSGEELIIPGTTPEDIRAEIRIDAGGIARRRDISAAGVVTWTEV